MWSKMLNQTCTSVYVVVNLGTCSVENEHEHEHEMVRQAYKEFLISDMDFL